MQTPVVVIKGISLLYKRLFVALTNAVVSENKHVLSSISLGVLVCLTCLGDISIVDLSFSVIRAIKKKT